MLLKSLQTFLVAVFLLVQGQALVKASEHVASGGLDYLCGDGRLPAEAVANIKYLLALQGEDVDGTVSDCELCFNFAFTEADVDEFTLAIDIEVSNDGAVSASDGPYYSYRTYVPVGLRAPPLS